MDELERARIRRTGVLGAAESAEELARVAEVVVAVEVEALDELERGLDVACLGHGGGPVELDDGRARETGELTVQPCQLRPVLRLVGVEEAIAACTT